MTGLWLVTGRNILFWIPYKLRRGHCRSKELKGQLPGSAGVASRSGGGERARMADGLAFSVVICTYAEKRWDELVAAVSSLRTQTLPPEEIIVVIDHNPELLARVGSELPDVTGVENPGRRGLSDARNSGLAVARGDVVAFLDDDAAAEPEWLAVLAEGYAGGGVVGGGGVAPAGPAQ